MEIEDEVRLKDLVEFGLTPLQARVYVALLRAGRATTGELAKGLRVNRVDVYRALKALERKGIVQYIVGTVKKYEAIEPATALKIMIEEAEEKLKAMKEKALMLRPWLESQRYHKMKIELEPEPSPLFRLIHGRIIFQKMINALKNAKTEVLRVSSPSGIKVNYILGIFDIEEKKAKDGVKIRAITDIQDEIIEEILVYSRFAEVRHLPKAGLSLRYTIIDDKCAFIFTNLPTPRPHEHASLFTQDSIIIDALKKNFEGLWTLAIDWEERKNELKVKV